jgi:cell division protein FtsQ
VNAKTTIRKIVFIAVWLCIGGGMLTLLLAAISKKNRGRCVDYKITVQGKSEGTFITIADVENQLLKSASGKLKGVSVSSFHLHRMEQELEHNSWIKHADLYFDNQDVLHVSVTEKEPVARIFTTGETSFYIDSASRRIPLSDKSSARVPVFSGFPDKKRYTSADSAMMRDITRLAVFIRNNSFWNSQVAQVNITENRGFELIPVVGNHIVKLGSAENLPQKFNRLMAFYEQVLRTSGFDKYKVIDVQFKGQVVASRYAGNPAIDSVQLRKNVERLLKQSLEAEETVMNPVNYEILKVDSSANLKAANVPEVGTGNVEGKDLTNKVNTKSLVRKDSETDHNRTEAQSLKPVKKPERTRKESNNVKQEKRKPKAVMPPKISEESNGGYN